MDEYYNNWSYPQAPCCFPCQDPCEDRDLECCEEPCECGGSWEWPWECCCEQSWECWCWEPCSCW